MLHVVVFDPLLTVFVVAQTTTPDAASSSSVRTLLKPTLRVRRPNTSIDHTPFKQTLGASWAQVSVLAPCPRCPITNALTLSTGTQGANAARLAIARAQLQLAQEANVHVHVRNFQGAPRRPPAIQCPDSPPISPP